MWEAISPYLNFGFLGPHIVTLGITMILALSLNMINGHAGLFSLGHAGFMCAGAYGGSAFCLYVLEGMSPWIVMPAGLAVATLTGAAFGLAVGVPCLRLRGDYLAIATLAFAEMIRLFVVSQRWLGQAAGFPTPQTRWPDHPAFAPAGHQTVVFLILTYVSLAVTVLIIRNIIASSHGRALLALREDELACQLLGVNVTRYKVFVFVLGAAMAGFAGGLFAMFTTFITPGNFNLQRTLILLLIVVLGGLGSITGTIIASVILYACEIILKQVDLSILGRPVGSELWLIAYAVLLIVLMILRPRGIMGRRKITDIVLLRRLAGAGTRTGGTHER